ncbi:angiomotin-like protein 1 isoform X2 [Chrysoperla carnea]|uniref:angiomotin-like protein 1 isoform X2 n=1 Tax=Chrysoperla carnea TaxID=189513 RepID=UPI001D08C932|nr:angiomotin-like protein 1 isoform X2 [Chrysoperla carnea]
MGSLQQSGRFISYGNTPQRSQTLQSQGFPPSLSGSETDISTSNENLSHEERYVIRHTARQEPQGQENLVPSNRNSLKESLPSNRSSLDVSSSSYNTLIIHSVGEDSWTGRNSLEGNGNGVQEITEIPDDYLNQSHVLKHLAKEVKVPLSSNANSPLRDSGVSENIDLDRLSVTRKDSSGIDSRLDYDLPSTPEYSKRKDKSSIINRHRMKFEKLSLSKSQPDLSKLGKEQSTYRRGASAPRPRTKGCEEHEKSEIWPSAEMVEILIQENSSLKLEIDNCYQKVAKAQKLEQEISNVHRSHEELVASCERRERLERAARARLQGECRRLQEVNRSLREQTDMMQAQLMAMRTVSLDTSVPGSADSLRKELGKREILIAQLITQNKELVAAKERQEIELAAQRATLQEQRTHIDILDNALINAQGNVVRLEEECRKKQMYVERVAQLQRALSSLQLASDRREQTERKLRLQLERELRSERSRPGDEGSGHNSGGSNNNTTGESSAELKRRLRERDEKIMRLEGECAKWEQRYLEESALRQAAIDAASIPKDAKIAALEKTSQDAEKLIAEARTEKIRHMDEVHATQKKVADLESRLKDYESKLAEKDAMIRVLQKHTYDKDVSSSSSFSNMLTRSPHHTPHTSLHGGTDLDTVLGTSVSREELVPVNLVFVFIVSSVLTGSTGFGSSNSYASSDSSYHMPSYSKYGGKKSFDSTKKTLDDQLKELDSQLDSQLLSKRGLCCFPGFSNPSTSPRKGKIPKPLLAGVVGSTGGQFESATGFLHGLVPGSSSRHDGNATRPEEMLLLEKQGRSSQQQRCIRNRTESLPPSSLPRPPRAAHRGTSQIRRLGEYGRLSSEENTRKKSDGGDSLSSNGSLSSKRKSPARSLIPSPRKLGEYGRLNESTTSSRKSSARSSDGSVTMGGNRNSASTMSDNSTSSLPTPSELKMYGSTSLIRRGSSLGRDGKTNESSNPKYRIQF